MQNEQQKHPLILTLKLDDGSQTWFDAQRKEHFPPERNFLQAHLTLFHHLPNNESTHDIVNNVNQTIFLINVAGLINLGAGVAYKIESQPLQTLHQQLAKAFTANLIPQDRQPFRPHITIMNKSTPANARALIDNLSKQLTPFTCTAIGLDLHTYLGGPWRFERTLPFSENPAIL